MYKIFSKLQDVMITKGKNMKHNCKIVPPLQVYAFNGNQKTKTD